jgi:Predicted glutamine amidotransferases
MGPRIGPDTGPESGPGIGSAIGPKIGIVPYTEDASWRGWHRRASLVPTDCLEAVARAGGVPILLPAQWIPTHGLPPHRIDSQAVDITAWIDGLLLVGGPDIDPAHYRQAREPETDGIQPERDAWELALLRAALAVGVPILGICRGMQLLNVVRGGTLRQQTTGHRPVGATFEGMEIRLDVARLPGSTLGATTRGHCHHHQTVDVLGAGLVATAWSPEGIVEAIELAERPFTVGVQWHPEVGSDPRLFDALVRAC